MSNEMSTIWLNDPNSNWFNAATADPSNSTFTIDGSTDGVATFFLAEALPDGSDPEAITHLGFVHTAVASPPVYRISLQGWSTTADEPDGTVKGGGSPASTTFTPSSGDNNDFVWRALDNSYTPSLGEKLALVIEYSSGTISTSNDMTVLVGLNNLEPEPGLPNTKQRSSGSWGGVVDDPPIYGIRGATHRYGLPIADYNDDNRITTSGHRQCMKFRLPSSVVTDFEVLAIRTEITYPSSGNPTWGLWNAAGTALQSDAWDEDYTATAGFSNETIWFSNPATLSPDTDYYVGLQSAGVSTGIAQWVLSDAGDRTAFVGGTDWSLSEWNGSTWTDTTTLRPRIVICIGNITYAGGGSGGGGRLINGGLVG